jgi:hypothetical protein
MRATGLALATVGLLSAACRGACADQVEPRAEQPDADAIVTTPDVPVAREEPNTVLHDCNGLEPSPPKACALSVEPWDGLVRRAERLTEIAAMHLPPEDAWWADFEAALGAAEGARPEAMTASDRVAVQNAALFLALSAARDARLPPVQNGPPGANEKRILRDRERLASRAMAVVRRLAFPPDARPASDDADPTLEAWLGPRAGWVERTLAGGPSFHQSVHGYTRMFRLVRTPTLRANFSQLVAVDTHGDPFVTSVVGSLETRRGFEPSARACVALPSPELTRCGASAGLAAVRDVSTLPHSHFFDRDDRDTQGRLRCNECHGPGIAFSEGHDLAPDAVAGDLATRRTSLLGELRTRFAPLWSR